MFTDNLWNKPAVRMRWALRWRTEPDVRDVAHDVIVSFPGLGELTGARVFAELGDDRTRFAARAVIGQFHHCLAAGQLHDRPKPSARQKRPQLDTSRDRRATQ